MVINRTMVQLPATSVNQRLALAVGLISETGLRLGEVVQACVDDLGLVVAENRWQLQVVDRSGATRQHALSSELFKALHSYFFSVAWR